jgi:hypothetical protein
MMLSFAVFSVFASLKLVFVGFPLFAVSEQTQYLLIGAVFLLSVLGAIGAGIVLRLPRLGGLFLLLSCAGVAALLFVPVIMQSFSFAPLEAYGIYISPLVLLIADFSMVLLTALGVVGGIMAFIPKRDRHAPAPAKARPAKVAAPAVLPAAVPLAVAPTAAAPVPAPPAAAPAVAAAPAAEPVAEPAAVTPPAAEPAAASPPVAAEAAEQPDIVCAAPPEPAGPPDVVNAAPSPPDIERLMNLE